MRHVMGARGLAADRVLWLACLMVAVAGFGVAVRGEDGQPDEPEVAEAAEESAADEAAESPDLPPEAEVRRETLRIRVELEGQVEAVHQHEIILRPEEWTTASNWVIEQAVAHGAQVNQGDVLIEFDTTKLDRAIRDLRDEREQGALSLQQAEFQLAALEETTPLDREAARRALAMSEEDQAHFFERQRPMNLRQTEFSLRSARNSLEYAQEELAQLKKMYEADDLVEETEAIVLRRAKNSVAAAQMNFDAAQLRHDYAMEFSHPREVDRVRDRTVRQRLETERAEVTLPLALERQRLEVQKARQQHERSEERLQHLEADRERMTVRAPSSGLVYYGKSTRGRFSDAGSLSENLRPQGTVQLNQVIMTVVEPQPVGLRLTVPEEQLHRMRIGLEGVAIPKGYPRLRLPVVVNELATIPLRPGHFDARAQVTATEAAPRVLPGMVCELRFESYVAHDALTIPPEALQTDPHDPDQHYVYRVDAEDRPVRRDVEVGEQTDKHVEILEGLQAGDRVLREAPE